MFPSIVLLCAMSKERMAIHSAIEALAPAVELVERTLVEEEPFASYRYTVRLEEHQTEWIFHLLETGIGKVHAALATQLAIVRYQPEEMVIKGERLYVANSGGYMKPNYERTLSVIDLKSFTEVDKIEVGMNLHRLRMDHNGRLWVTSRGNYGNVPSNLYYIDLDQATQKVSKLDSLNMPCAQMAFYGDKLYYYSSVWDSAAKKMKIGFGLVDIDAAKPLAESFITDGTDSNIQTAYGLAIHPVSGDIYIMDAKDYRSSGTLYCYTPDGKLKWQTGRTGMLPAHIAFVKQ